MRTLEELEEFFSEHRMECRMKSKDIPEAFRRDLEAFKLLDQLVPGNDSMIAGANHDEIYLGVSLQDLAKVATDDQLIRLIRYGVRIQEDSLHMFV